MFDKSLLFAWAHPQVVSRAYAKRPYLILTWQVSFHFFDAEFSKIFFSKIIIKRNFTSCSNWLWYLTLSSCRAFTFASNCFTRSESDSKVSLNWSSRFDRCRLSISACSPFNVLACWVDKNWQSDRALSSCWISPWRSFYEQYLDWDVHLNWRLIWIMIVKFTHFYPSLK